MTSSARLSSCKSKAIISEIIFYWLYIEYIFLKFDRTLLRKVKHLVEKNGTCAKNLNKMNFLLEKTGGY